MLIAFVVFGKIFSQTKIYSYQEAIDQALLNNKEVINAQYQVQRTQQQANYNIYSEVFPTIKFAGSYQYMLAIPITYLHLGEAGGLVPGGSTSSGYMAVKTGIAQTMNSMISLSQPIYNHAAFVGMKSIQYMNNQSILQMEATEENIAYNTGASYYNLQIAGQQIALLDTNVRLLEESLKSSQSLYENSIMSKNDYNKLIVNLENLKNDRSNAVLNQTKLQNLLKFLMGIPLQDTVIIENFNEERSFEDSIENIDPFTVIGNRTDIKAQELQIKLDEINKSVAFSSFVPTLSLSLNAGYSGFNDQFNPIRSINNSWPFSSAVSLNLNYTIFQGMKAHYHYRDKKLAVLQSKNKLENIKDEAIKDVMDSYADFSTAKNNLLKNKANYMLSSEIYAYEISQYKEGLVSLIELLQSQNDYTQARNNYLTGIVNVKSSELNYKKAIGKIIQRNSSKNKK
ncbi:MAG: TolC family protein [Chitinophagaceae bacterium]